MYKGPMGKDNRCDRVERGRWGYFGEVRVMGKKGGTVVEHNKTNFKKVKLIFKN